MGSQRVSAALSRTDPFSNAKESNMRKIVGKIPTVQPPQRDTSDDLSTLFERKMPRRWTLMLLGSIALAAAAQDRAPAETAWFRDFMTWAASLPPDVAPAAIEPMYKERLASKGLPPLAIEQRWSSIQMQQRDSEEWLRMAVNRSYSHGWYAGKPPSKFLADFIRGKKPGKALDCGMGAGRNAVFLASLGWNVTGIDISDVALEQAKSLAAKNHVEINAIRSSFRELNWGTDEWDLILNIDSWDGEGERPSTFAAAPLRSALRPEGLLYVETHLPALMSPDKPLLKLFPGLNVWMHETKPDPDWQGRNKNGILIFVAHKPRGPVP